MKGIPAFIKTREDLQNLFALAQEGKENKSELAEKIRELLSLQHHRVPILSTSGKTVTTRYFPEVNVGDETDAGVKVTAVKHVEAEEQEGEGTTYESTVITFAAAPGADKLLSIYLPDNYLTQNDFDLAEINYILGVLEQ